MLSLVLAVVLGATVVLGTLLGSRYRVAPPVLLLVLGGLLGLAPRLAGVHLEPDVVLLLFLPAILYYESLTTSLREIRANLRTIVLSSVVLVVVSMVVVAFAARALGVAPRAAWVLGAALAPTDAAAMAGLAQRLPRRIQTTLKAESLINDGTALVLLAVTVSAAVDHTTPTALGLTGRFLGSYAGGVAAGLVASTVVLLVRTRVHDPLVGAALGILTPFLGFLLAEVASASGVVAVVVSGLVASLVGPRRFDARARTQALAFWDLTTFLVNGSLWVLVGMQFPRALRGVRGDEGLGGAAAVALAVAGAVILTRLLWVHLITAVIRTVDRRAVQRTRRVGWRARTASGWAGFRGAVSLAAALAVPTTLADGSPFPDRDVIVFTTLVVVLVTVVLQGTTLPAVVRWAGLTEDAERAHELREATVRASRAGLDSVSRLAGELGVADAVAERVRSDYEQHVSGLLADGSAEDARAREHERRLRLAVLGEKRATVTRLRDTAVIDDIVLRDLQAAMDLEEIRLRQPLAPSPADDAAPAG